MKHSLTFVFCIAVFSGCASSQKSEKSAGTATTQNWMPSVQQQEESRHLQALSETSEKTVVDSSDGISEVEAYKIAHDYFFGRGFTPCGIVDIPKDEGIVWRVPLLEGIFPGPSMDVVIEKKSGSYRIEDVRKRKPIQRTTDNSGTAPLRV